MGENNRFALIIVNSFKCTKILLILFIDIVFCLFYLQSFINFAVPPIYFIVGRYAYVY